MMDEIKNFIKDEKGDTSTVFKLVLAITIIAAILVILLFVLQNAQSSGQVLTNTMNHTTSQLNSNLSDFTKAATTTP